LRVAHQLSLELERLRLVRVDRQRAADGFARQMLFARLVAQAADVHPQARIGRPGGQGAVECPCRRAEVPRGELEPAERMKAALRARPVELARRKPAACLVRIVLQELRFAEVGVDRLVRLAGVERAPRGDFGGHAVAPLDGGRRIRERIVAPAGQRGERQQGKQDRQESLVRPAGHSA